MEDLDGQETNKTKNISPFLQPIGADYFIEQSIAPLTIDNSPVVRFMILRTGAQLPKRLLNSVAFQLFLPEEKDFFCTDKWIQISVGLYLDLPMGYFAQIVREPTSPFEINSSNGFFEYGEIMLELRPICKHSRLETFQHFATVSPEQPIARIIFQRAATNIFPIDDHEQLNVYDVAIGFGDRLSLKGSVFNN